MADAPFDVETAHRWFGAALNNLAWELVEAASRTSDDIERMIHAAHGACFHWLEVGGLLHHLRAQCLLATAYATAGLADSAVRHAERCLDLSAQVGETQTPFDRACAEGSAAAAFAAAGRQPAATEHFSRLRAAIDLLQDDEEREVVRRLYMLPLQGESL